MLNLHRSDEKTKGYIMTVERMLVEPDQSYFLFGPCGTGKSTLVKVRYPDALVIDLLLPTTRRMYQANPERLIEIVHALPPGAVIIIDEIQKVPELLTVVHILIEEKKSWRFILTSSSARKLKREGIDLLGGRALRKTMHPFLACELGERFDLEDVLRFGLLPLRYASTDPMETLMAYIALYLEEEVKSEGLVRRVGPFSYFLEVLSFSHGTMLNISNIARECGIKRSTGDTWLSIVEDLLICYRVPVFRSRSKRLLVSHSKLYLFDVGVYRSLRPRSLLDSEAEIDGAALEGLVAQHLRAWSEYTAENHKLFFWRTKGGLEVDFVVFGSMGLWAIEVKNSQHVHPADLRSLGQFKVDYPEARLLLLYRGTVAVKRNDILCLPVDRFLKHLIPNRPLWQRDSN